MALRLIPNKKLLNVHIQKKTLKCVKYVSNYDGDTVSFDIPGLHPIIGKDVAVRLRGVDTAEINTKDECEKYMALKAKDYVRDSLKGAKDIKIKKITRGMYFRIIGAIKVDDKDLASQLIKGNLGVPYKGDTKRPDTDWCKN